jgi:hypothetical protein
MVKGPGGKQMPMQSVPTSIARGPDGAYYLGELTGFPFPQGAARIYRVEPGRAPTVYAKGFTNVIDLAFGREGSLYVLEIVKDGLLAGACGGPAASIAAGPRRFPIVRAGRWMMTVAMTANLPVMSSRPT